MQRHILVVGWICAGSRTPGVIDARIGCARCRGVRCSAPSERSAAVAGAGVSASAAATPAVIPAAARRYGRRRADRTTGGHRKRRACNHQCGDQSGDFSCHGISAG
jgi:hypothetical protein